MHIIGIIKRHFLDTIMTYNVYIFVASSLVFYINLKNSKSTLFDYISILVRDMKGVSNYI